MVNAVTSQCRNRECFLFCSCGLADADDTRDLCDYRRNVARSSIETAGRRPRAHGVRFGCGYEGSFRTFTRRAEMIQIRPSKGAGHPSLSLQIRAVLWRERSAEVKRGMVKASVVVGKSH
jgi:hypothetical protein